MKKAISLFLILALCLSLCACGVDARYTALIECLDNHDYEGAYAQVSMMRQEAIDNGDIVVVEPQEEDYDLVNRYQTVGYFLKDYTPDGYNGIYNQANEEYLSGNDALAYAYSELQALEAVDQWLDSEYFHFEEGFPTDRAALLSRFTVLSNQLVKTTRTTLDNMHNENTELDRAWYYDEAGVLVKQNINWRAADSVWENLYSQSGFYRYTYNDAGMITETKITDQEGTNIYAVVIPTYDAAGNLVKESITDNYGDYEFNYTYDANGNRIQTDYKDDWRDYSIFYTYDGAGNLIQKDRIAYTTLNDETVEDMKKTTVYTYDASGNLTSATITDQDFSWRWNGDYEIYVYSEKVDTVAYTCDAEGRVIQEVWQYGETFYEDGETQKPDSITQTLDYVYGDYYIFN